LRLFLSLFLGFEGKSEGKRQELIPGYANRFSTKYDFAKPNDTRALDLMNAAAVAVMKELPDLVLAYGISDEYRYFFLY
jgi:tRNAHis guanylyltransferase